jgi:hypothetical protein
MHPRSPDVPPRLPAERVVDGKQDRFVLGDEAQRELEQDEPERIEVPYGTAEESVEAGEVLLLDRARRNDEPGHGMAAEAEHPAGDKRQEARETRLRENGNEAQGELRERRYEGYHHDPFLHAGLGHPAFRRNGSSSLAAFAVPLNNGETQG